MGWIVWTTHEKQHDGDKSQPCTERNTLLKKNKQDAKRARVSKQRTIPQRWIYLADHGSEADRARVRHSCKRAGMNFRERQRCSDRGGWNGIEAGSLAHGSHTCAVHRVLGGNANDPHICSQRVHFRTVVNTLPCKAI
jgi:hypothetical protein